MKGVRKQSFPNRSQTTGLRSIRLELRSRNQGDRKWTSFAALQPRLNHEHELLLVVLPFVPGGCRDSEERPEPRAR